jgi:Lipopolysaccharide-assembly
MTSKINLQMIALCCLLFCLQACGIYSFTGANVEGKTINISFIENKARLVTPALSNVLTEKVRNKILNQTTLSQVNSDKTDYTLKGTITNYEVSIASVKNTQTVGDNRLTITAEFVFANNIDPKKNFTRTYTKFADFAGTQTLQQAEGVLIEQISKEIAEVIFNDAFVNW